MGVDDDEDGMSAISANSSTMFCMRFASSSGCASTTVVKNWAKPTRVRAGMQGLADRGRGRGNEGLYGFGFVFGSICRSAKELGRGNVGDVGLDETDITERLRRARAVSAVDGGTR